MQLKLFKTLWGYTGDVADAVREAVAEGYDGIEAPVPVTAADRARLAALLSDAGLDYIAEIATTGTYVPNRSLSLQDHLDDLARRTAQLQELHPLFITCLGGCDAWPLAESLAFFRQAIGIAGMAGMNISFETHRGRSLFNPWITRQVVEMLPELRLTCDFSHWYVVCEGIQQSEQEIIRQLVPRARHIHGRVGYDQGPQVPDPRSAVYARELEQHLKWWRWIWEQQYKDGCEWTSVTPEFGPDGYDYRNPATGATLIEPGMLNNWMASRLRNEYRKTVEI